MRFRLFGIAALTMAAVAVVSGCDSAPTAETTTAVTTTQSIQVTPPADEWRAAGDLCKIITGDVVSKLFNKPPLEAYFNQEYAESGDHPGPDFCGYALKKPDGRGYAVLDILVIEYSSEQWEEFRHLMKDGASRVTEFTIEGVDEAFRAKGQVWARKGNVAATASGMNINETLDETRLAELAAMAAMLCG